MKRILISTLMFSTFSLAAYSCADVLHRFNLLSEKKSVKNMNKDKAKLSKKSQYKLVRQMLANHYDEVIQESNKAAFVISVLAVYEIPENSSITKDEINKKIADLKRLDYLSTRCYPGDGKKLQELFKTKK